MAEGKPFSSVNDVINRNETRSTGREERERMDSFFGEFLNRMNTSNSLSKLEESRVELERCYDELREKYASLELRHAELEDNCARLEVLCETLQISNDDLSSVSLSSSSSSEVRETREVKHQSVTTVPKSISIYDPRFLQRGKYTVTYSWCEDYSLFPPNSDIHELDSYGNNILTRSNNLELTALALKSGVSVHHFNKNGLSVMHFLYRVPVCLDLLVSAGGNINVRDTKTGQTPLFLCSSLELCKRMQVLGALLDVTDKKGNTLLHCAKSKTLYTYYLAQGVKPVANHAGQFPKEK